MKIQCKKIPENTGNYRKILGILCKKSENTKKSQIPSFFFKIQVLFESAEYFDTLFYYYHDQGIIENQILGEVMKFLICNIFLRERSEYKPTREVFPNLFSRYEYWVEKIFGPDSLRAVKGIFPPYTCSL